MSLSGAAPLPAPQNLHPQPPPPKKRGKNPMKKYKKSEIAAFLEDFQKRLSAVNKAVQKKTSIESDAVGLEKNITALGRPNYRDTDKFALLTAKGFQLKACQEALEEQKTVIGERLASLAEIVEAAGVMAYGILADVVGNRLHTVTSCLLPFCASRASAESLARQTDACRGAWAAISAYSHRPTMIRKFTGLRTGETETMADYGDQNLAPIMRVASDCERVLSESLSKAPDLMQFIPFSPTTEKQTDAVPESLAAADDSAG